MAESDAHTTLETEITTNGGARAAATTAYEADYKAKWSKTFNFTGALAINEYGVFNAASAGTMLLRKKLATTKNVANGESLQITVTLTLASA